MAKAPAPKARAGITKSSTKKTKSPPPSHAAQAIIDDIWSPMTQAVAAELFAVRVIDIARKFDPFWFHLVADLATLTINQCDERTVMATLRDVTANPDSMRAHVLRRKINRNLPLAPGDSKLTETERYELARAILIAACETLKDEELWEALWGRKDEWSTVIIADGEPGPEPDDEGRKSDTVGYRADRETEAAN